MNFKKIINEFSKLGYTISTMESCTGGGVANALTNCEDASSIFNYSAVTYSNDFKIKMGVDPNIISKYSVYSIECARSMSRAISDFTSSTYGVGVTGKINKVDKNNPYGDDSTVFISVYNSLIDKYKEATIVCTDMTREKNKEIIINKVIELIEEDL